MTPQQTQGMLLKYGETVVLRRPTGNGNWIECPVRARVDLFQPHEVVGGILQGDRKVIISPVELDASGWLGGLRRGDQVMIGGTTTTVQGVDVVTAGDVVQRMNMQVRGG